MFTFALLLAAAAPTPALDGEAHRLAIRAQFVEQMYAHSRACNAAAQGLSTTSAAESCGAVLAADHVVRSLDRAVLKKKKAPTPRTIRCATPKGLTPPDDERAALTRCLTSTYGTGALAPAVDADFGFSLIGRVIRGTGVERTADSISFTLLDDDTDGVHLDVAFAAHTMIGVPAAFALPITTGAPLGSDRVVVTVGSQLEIDTPVVGGVVVCNDRAKILPLGAFVDVVLQAPGYHPEQDPKRPVYRSAVPCPGTFVGAGVALKTGAYKPAPPRNVDARPALSPVDCTGEMCRYELPNKDPISVSFYKGEDSLHALTPLGDVNHDGVVDWLASYGDAGGGLLALYLSKDGRHVLAAQQTWTS